MSESPIICPICEEDALDRVPEHDVLWGEEFLSFLCKECGSEFLAPFRLVDEHKSKFVFNQK